jgi:alkylation response protein AidB-like acyl-CoA dehydrogenase
MGRLGLAAHSVGIAQRLMEASAQYAKSRVQFGKPIAANQAIQWMLADAATEIHAARLMVLHAAWKIEKEGAEAAREEISLIKFTVARIMQRVLDRTIQGLGALGMTDNTPLAWWYAHERAARIYDGPDEVHLEVVARRILRRYGMSAP